jgi:hypothetical protein
MTFYLKIAVERTELIKLNPGMTGVTGQLYSDAGPYTPLWRFVWQMVSPLVFGQFKLRYIGTQVSAYGPFYTRTLMTEFATLAERTMTNSLNADLAVIARLFLLALNGGITQFSEFVRATNLADLYASLVPEAADEAHRAVSTAVRDELKPFLVSLLRQAIRQHETRNVARNARSALDVLIQGDVVTNVISAAARLSRELIEVYRTYKLADPDEVFLRLTQILLDNEQTPVPLLTAINDVNETATDSISITGESLLPFLHELGLLQWLQWTPHPNLLGLVDGQTEVPATSVIRPIFYTVSLPHMPPDVDLPDLLQWVQTVTGVWASYLPAAADAVIHRSIQDLLHAVESLQIRTANVELLYTPDDYRNAPSRDPIFRMMTELAVSRLLVNVLGGASTSGALASYIAQQIGIQQLTDVRRMDIAVGFGEVVGGLPLFVLRLYDQLIDSLPVVRIGGVTVVNTPVLRSEFRKVIDRVVDYLKSTYLRTTEAAERLDHFETRAHDLISESRYLFTGTTLGEYGFAYSQDSLLRRTQLFLFMGEDKNQKGVYDYTFLSNLEDVSSWVTLDANLDRVIQYIGSSSHDSVVNVNGMFIQVLRVNFNTGLHELDKLGLLVPRFLEGPYGLIDLEYVRPRVHEFRDTVMFFDNDDIARFLGYASWDNFRARRPQALVQVIERVSDVLTSLRVGGRPQQWLVAKFPIIVLSYVGQEPLTATEVATRLATAYDRKYHIWHLTKGIETYFTQLDNTTTKVEIHVPMLVPENLGIAYRNKIVDVTPAQLPEVQATVVFSDHAPTLLRTGVVDEGSPKAPNASPDAQTEAEDSASGV